MEVLIYKFSGIVHGRNMGVSARTRTFSGQIKGNHAPDEIDMHCHAAQGVQ